MNNETARQLDLNDYTPTPNLAQASTLPARWYTDPAFLELEKARPFTTGFSPTLCSIDIISIKYLAS